MQEIVEAVNIDAKWRHIRKEGLATAGRGGRFRNETSSFVFIEGGKEVPKLCFGLSFL